MDKTAWILLIILLIVIGLFAIISFGSDGGSSTGGSIASSYANQYGGGCGR